jgi:hypothetical protein
MTTNTTQVSSNQQTDSLSQNYSLNVGSFSDQYKNVNLVLQTLQRIKEDEQKLVNPKLSIIDKFVIYQDLSNFFQGIGKYSAFALSTTDSVMRNKVRSAVNKSLQQFNDVTIPVPDGSARIKFNGRPATLADIIINWTSDSKCFSFSFKRTLSFSTDPNEHWLSKCKWEKDFGKDNMKSFNNYSGYNASAKPFELSSKNGDPIDSNGIRVSSSIHTRPCHEPVETLTISMSATTLAKYMTVKPPTKAYPGASLTSPLDNALLDLGL